MDLNTILLAIAGLVPAVVLCIYVYKKDRAEKEPIGLLLLLLGAGALTCFPAGYIEGVVIPSISDFFAQFGTASDGLIYLESSTYNIYQVAVNFIGVALVEEGVKMLALVLITKNNKNFNSLFDGIIYSVFVSLGFAALENVKYVTNYGWVNAAMRAVLSVPGHMFFAVLMGYYYSWWKIRSNARDTERILKAQGIIPQQAAEFTTRKYMALALVVPVLAHGWYDFCCSVDKSWSTAALYIFVIFLYIYCFGKIKKMSDIDAPGELFSKSLVIKKYPQLLEMLSMKKEKSEATTV